MLNRVHARFVRGVLCVIAIAAGLIAPAGARPHPTPTPAPTPTPVADPAVTKVVRQQFVAWQSGTINRNLYSAEVLPKLSDAKINDVARVLAALGPLNDTQFIGPFSAVDIPAGAHGYIYQMHCAEGDIYMWMILDADGKIATVFFKDTLEVETIERPGTPSASPQPKFDQLLDH